MAKPKIMFRGGRRNADYGEGCLIETASDDIDLSPNLADIVQTFRTMYGEELPDRSSILATLRALSRVADTEVNEALETLHAQAEAHLLLAAYHAWRNSHPDGEIPAGQLSPCAWSPEQLRDNARAALDLVPEAPGRPSTADMDSQFARALALYWRSIGKATTVTVEQEDVSKESEFLSWAWEMFQRAGRDIAPATLAKVLRRAIKPT